MLGTQRAVPGAQARMSLAQPRAQGPGAAATPAGRLLSPVGARTTGWHTATGCSAGASSFPLLFTGSLEPSHSRVTAQGCSSQGRVEPPDQLCRSPYLAKEQAHCAGTVPRAVFPPAGQGRPLTAGKGDFSLLRRNQKYFWSRQCQ